MDKKSKKNLIEIVQLALKAASKEFFVSKKGKALIKEYTEQGLIRRIEKDQRLTI